jgi:hypothetical protein
MANSINSCRWEISKLVKVLPLVWQDAESFRRNRLIDQIYQDIEDLLKQMETMFEGLSV